MHTIPHTSSHWIGGIVGWSFVIGSFPLQCVRSLHEECARNRSSVRPSEGSHIWLESRNYSDASLVTLTSIQAESRWKYVNGRLRETFGKNLILHRAVWNAQFIIYADLWHHCGRIVGVVFIVKTATKIYLTWHRQKLTLPLDKVKHQPFISVMFVQIPSISPVRGGTKIYHEEHVTCRTCNGTHLQYLQKWEWELLFLISLCMKLKQSGPHTCVCEVTWVKWGLMALWGLWDFWEMAVIGFRLWLLSWGVRGKLWRTSTRRQTGCSRSTAG